MSTQLNPGDPAPDFTTVNQDGATVQLSKLRGKPVLIYFYPKDDTPGCTKESCELRNEYAEYQKLGAMIFGISRQDASSHKEFKAKYRLPFDLLVDADGKIAESFGVGKIFLLGWLQRQSILIGADGKIAKLYRKVSPSSHADEVLRDLRQLGGSAAAHAS
jgi:thioredoxin-dependent peroxiredoxin